MIESLFLLSISLKIRRIIRIQPFSALASLQETFMLLIYLAFFLFIKGFHISSIFEWYN